MKKKSFFAGMLTMLLIVTLVVPAAATVGKVTKELEYRNISVTLDGVKLDLKNAKGEPVEPFMFEGTNYLPVRALAESLGLNVAWNGQTATVVLTSPNAETKTTFGTGMYLVGKDMPAGTYFLTVTDEKWGGYWEKTSDATGDFKSIIANGTFDATAYVTVKEGEYFKFDRANAVLQ